MNQKKWIVLLICVVLLCAIVTGCGSEDATANGAYTVTVQIEDLKSGEKSEETISLVYNGEGLLVECQEVERKWEYSYDRQGRKISAAAYDLAGTLTIEYVYSYNHAGAIAQIERWEHSEDSSVCAAKTEYRYFQSGNLAYCCFYVDGTQSMECYYDENGNLLEELDYYSSETVSRNAYTYTEDGKLLTSYREQYGEPHIEEMYEYNEAGFLVRKTEIHTCGSLPADETVTTYSFDSLGRCIRADAVTDQGVASFAEYTYDAMGNMLSYTQSGDRSSYVWTYDAQGRMLSCEKTAGNYSVLCTWVYDAQGNVLEYISGDTRHTFAYSCPGEEMPAEVRKELTKRLVLLTDLTLWSWKSLAQIG